MLPEKEEKTLESDMRKAIERSRKEHKKASQKQKQKKTSRIIESDDDSTSFSELSREKRAWIAQTCRLQL